MSKDKLEEMWANIQNTTRHYTRILILYLLLNMGVFLFLQLISGMKASFTFTIWLSDGIDAFETVQFPVYTVIEIIMTGPLVSMVMVYCFRKMVQFWEVDDIISDRKEKLLNILILLCVLLLNTGVFTNRIFNIVSAHLKEIPAAHDQYVWAYFLDEFLGHTLSHLGLSLFLFTMALTMPLNTNLLGEKSYRMNGGERVLVFIPALAYGVINSYANLEGQTALLTLVFLSILAILLILVVKKVSGKVFIINRPFLLFIISQVLVMVVFLTIWVVATGIKPFYPFFFQPTEL
ncbi:MAG: hypothetical protein ACTSUE_26315 [Promethearchaeota archaeon]